MSICIRLFASCLYAWFTFWVQRQGSGLRMCYGLRKEWITHSFLQNLFCFLFVHNIIFESVSGTRAATEFILMSASQEYLLEILLVTCSDGGDDPLLDTC